MIKTKFQISGKHLKKNKKKNSSKSEKEIYKNCWFLFFHLMNVIFFSFLNWKKKFFILDEDKIFCSTNQQKNEICMNPFAGGVTFLSL